MENEKFWLVWSPTGTHSPVKRHHSAEAANTEARRLARAHAGQQFIVMEAIEGFAVDNLKHTVFLHPIPF